MGKHYGVYGVFVLTAAATAAAAAAAWTAFMSNHYKVVIARGNCYHHHHQHQGSPYSTIFRTTKTPRQTIPRIRPLTARKTFIIVPRTRRRRTWLGLHKNKDNAEDRKSHNAGSIVNPNRNTIKTAPSITADGSDSTAAVSLLSSSSLLPLATTKEEQEEDSTAVTPKRFPTIASPPTPFLSFPRQQHILSIDGSKHAAVCSRTIPITPSWVITVWEWQHVAPVIETYWQVEQQGLQISLQNSNRRNHRERLKDQEEEEEEEEGQPISSSNMLDPFGLVTWPGSVIASLELLRHRHLVHDKVVWVIGAGVGVEAQALAALGARRVLATDVHPTTLQLLEYGVRQASTENVVVETRIWDLYGTEPIPSEPIDLIVCADVLYNDKLETQLVRRLTEVYYGCRNNNQSTHDNHTHYSHHGDEGKVVVEGNDTTTTSTSNGNSTTPITLEKLQDEFNSTKKIQQPIEPSPMNNKNTATSTLDVAVPIQSDTNTILQPQQTQQKPPPVVPVTLIVDSQRFCHGFEQSLNVALREQGLRRRVNWESRFLPQFTGSGMLVDEDQTYDVKARLLWIGL